jgi:pyruvate-ferredoxin/flavodoxin oxidoreductase
VAYKLSEVIAIYPITPSTAMGEQADAWSALRQPNLWGTVPELTATVFHVAARSLAAQGLSIFGDHSDVMAARSTGWTLLASSTVQEAHDMALIAHAATLATRVPILHFFDGFRTSHKLNQVELISDETMRALIDERLVVAHRQRGLSPDRPFIRGTAQNPDVYFQARESVNPFYSACPAIVQQTMDRFAAETGRAYHLFDYAGAPDAERVMVIMGSGAETAQETAAYLAAAGEKVGVLTVRLYRPFAVQQFLAALPASTRAIAVLDRTKEPGSAGEPLYLDVLAALTEGLAQTGGRLPRVIGGRYGLSSKEFTPAMARAVFDELASAEPKNHFTLGIDDDVMHTSLTYIRRSRSRMRPRRAVCSGALARTARSAPIRTRSRSSAKRPAPMPRATSCTTRRSPARSRSRTCASASSPSTRPTLSAAPASWPATSSASLSASTC